MFKYFKRLFLKNMLRSISGLFCVIFLAVGVDKTLGLPLELDEGQTLIMNSSLTTDEFQIVIAAAKDNNNDLKILSNTLSPYSGAHTVMFSEKQMIFSPNLEDQKILFNEFHDNSYWLGLKHQFRLKKDLENHFFPLEVTSKDKAYGFLLPGLEIPMTFIPQDSFYRCESLLISLQAKGDVIEIAIFSKFDLNNNWKLDSEWKNKWRHVDHGISYGWGERTDGKKKFSISMNNGHYCDFTEEHFERTGVPMMSSQQYYQFVQILKKAKYVPSKKIQPQQEEL